MVCECCLNKFCVSLLFWAWNVYCAAAAVAYIKNQLTGITVFRCKSRRISSALWNACIWQSHWFCGRPRSPLTFSKLGKLFPFRWGCLNYNWLSDRSYRWQECFLTALSVFEHSRAVDTEARRINSESFINGLCIELSSTWGSKANQMWYLLRYWDIKKTSLVLHQPVKHHSSCTTATPYITLQKTKIWMPHLIAQC